MAHSSSWPEEFVCPISLSVMGDPVIVSSGQSYERRCIEAWFALGQTRCVVQGVLLESNVIIPNICLKSAIKSMAKSRGLPTEVPLPPSADDANELAEHLLREKPYDDLRSQGSYSSRSTTEELVCQQIEEVNVGNLENQDTTEGIRLNNVDKRSFKDKMKVAFGRKKGNGMNEVQKNVENLENENMKEASRLKNVHRRALNDKVGVALGIMKGKEMKEIDEVQNSIISSQLDSRDYGVDDGHAEPSTFSISEQAASDLGGDINLSTSSSLPDIRKPREASGDEWKGQNVLRRSSGIENRSVDLLQYTRAETAPNEGNLPATIRSTSQHPFTNPVTDLRSDFSKGPSYGTHGARKLPPDLLTRPSYSSSQPPQTPSSPTSVSDSLVKRMKSPYQEDQEAAVAEARQLSREQKNRMSLCSADIVAALIELFQSKNVKVQVDAIAALVNLSIEIQNKSVIVQAGALPFLIEVLNSGCPEAQEHAAAAAFTLAIADESKHSMGILNAIPPLLKILNFGPEGAREDAAMALYHLSLMQSNKSKLIKSGAIPILFNLAQSTERLGLVSKVLMVLVNVASVPEGRAALLQMNPIPALVRLLQIQDDSDATMIPEQAATLLLFLSKSNLRFKSIAENAGAIELLRDMVGRGTVRGREKASKLLEIMKDTSLGLDDSDRNPFLANQYMRFRINDGQPNSSAF